MALPTASDNEFPKVILEEVADDGSATVTPAADHRALFLGEDGTLKLKDSAGSVTTAGGDVAAHTGDTTDAHDASAISFTPAGTIAATDVQAAIEEVAAEAGGGGITDRQILAWPYTPYTGTANVSNAGFAWAMPITLSGPMLIRNFWCRIATGATGTVEFGLFDYSSNAAAATKVAGGTGAMNATGSVSVAAASAPVSVPAGNYILIMHMPGSNQPTVVCYSYTTTNGPAKQIDPYTWDDTPDFTTGWAAAAQAPACWITGDLDGSNQWL